MTDDGRTGSEYAEGQNHLMSWPSPTDLELVRGLHARDPKTLASVYGDYHAAIYNLCARILGDREEAKDVTQDVFVKAFSKPPEMTEDVRLRPWLFRVATNACFNLIRGRRSGDPVATEELAARGDPYEQAQTAALIETSLACMNERYRAALVLKDLRTSPWRCRCCPYRPRLPRCRCTPLRRSSRPAPGRPSRPASGRQPAS
jgi:RNA polymerase sigma-70 factor (ECF subfamily)